MKDNIKNSLKITGIAMCFFIIGHVSGLYFGFPNNITLDYGDNNHEWERIDNLSLCPNGTIRVDGIIRNQPIYACFNISNLDPTFSTVYDWTNESIIIYNDSILNVQRGKKK